MRIRLYFINAILLAISGTLQAATAMGDVTMGINMVVSDVTCNINDGKGISQQVIMPIVSQDELRANSVPSVDVPLLVDCRSSASQPTAIAIRLNPAGGGSIVGDGSNGILKTDHNGIGLELTWKSITGHPPASLLPGHETVFNAGSGGLWDLSLIARPVLIAGEVPEMGRYVGTLQINLKYT